MSIKDSTIDQTLLLKIRAVFSDYELAVLTEINLRGPKSVTKLTMVFCLDGSTVMVYPLNRPPCHDI